MELSLTDMSDTCEIKYALVPNTNGKSDLWKHFNLHKQKTDGQIDADAAVCKQCSSNVKLAGGASKSNKSTHMKHHHPLLLLGSPVVTELKADMLVCISWYTGILHRYGHKIWLHIAVCFL